MALAFGLLFFRRGSLGEGKTRKVGAHKPLDKLGFWDTRGDAMVGLSQHPRVLCSRPAAAAALIFHAPLPYGLCSGWAFCTSPTGLTCTGGT